MPCFRGAGTKKPPRSARRKRGGSPFRACKPLSGNTTNRTREWKRPKPEGRREHRLVTRGLASARRPQAARRNKRKTPAAKRYRGFFFFYENPIGETTNQPDFQNGRGLRPRQGFYGGNRRNVSDSRLRAQPIMHSTAAGARSLTPGSG
jgi:hypothetical protein